MSRPERRRGRSARIAKRVDIVPPAQPPPGPAPETVRTTVVRRRPAVTHLASAKGPLTMENARLRVETLGPLRAYADGRELDLGPPKQRAVFAVLALNAGSLVSRDDLVDHLWGESCPATAVGSLHTYVSGLRRALGPLGDSLTSSSSGYALRLDPEALDLRVVERLAARARSGQGDPASAVTALDDALAHWRPGTVLGGLPGPFADRQRAAAADLRLRLLMERAELLLALARPADAAEQLAAHVAANPYHERLRALLITALDHSGRTADALAQYQDLRRRLAEDLGIDPTAELRALHTSILADDTETREVVPPPAAPEVRPAQLPRGVGNFVGRVDAVRQVLDAAADDDSTRITMVVGVGGVGKTELAVRCANLLAGDYPDGQLYVNLRGFDPKQPPLSTADTLRHLLASLNVGTIPPDRDQRVALWRSIVRDLRMLIVFDNAESADQVEDLLPGAGPSFVLVTSRSRLSGLAVRYSARRVTLSPLSSGESLDMLSAALGGARVGAEQDAARRLAELCDHLPLALRIASEQANARSQVADVVTDLEDVRRRLDALQIPDDELHSVRAVLSLSYVRLDARAARAFRALGLFPGGSIRVEAAAALLAVPPVEAASALRSLAAQHLVESTPNGYSMHDLTHIYAEEASRTGETTASRRQDLKRVLQWYVRTLARDYKSADVALPFTLDFKAPHARLRFDERKDFIAWCAQEWDNIAPLVRAAQRAGCHEQAWQLAYLLFGHFYAAGSARAWVEILRIGMRSADMIGDRRAQAALLNHLSVANIRMGRNDAAVRGLKRGLRLLEDLGEDVLRVSILANLASAYREAKDYGAALAYAGQALELARRSGSEYYKAGSLDVLAKLHAELGNYTQSARYGTAALAAARRSRNVLLEAGVLLRLGIAQSGLGDVETARPYFQEVLSLCESSGDSYHGALALYGLARIDRAGSARDLATRALQRLKELDAEEVAEVAEFLAALDAGLPAGEPTPRPEPTRPAGCAAR